MVTVTFWSQIQWRSQVFESWGGGFRKLPEQFRCHVSS